MCNHQRHQLRGVGLAGTELGELLVFVEALLLQLLDVVDAGYRGDGKAAQMRIDHNGLGISVADDADTVVALEFVQLAVELGAEIGVFDVVNGTVESAVLNSHHAGTLGAQMRMVVYSVKQIANACLT